MKVVYWISLVLVVLTLAPSLLYWMLYLSTGEAVARARATNMFRWCIVVVLGTFNIWIFGRVFGAVRDIRPSPPPPPPPPVSSVQNSCTGQEFDAATVRQRGAGGMVEALAQQLNPCIAPG